MKKNILDNLKVDEKLITEEEPQEPHDLVDASPPPSTTRPKMQAHLMRKSLQREQNQWRDILLSPEPILYMRFSTKLAAQSRRTRLYHARTYLMTIYEEVDEYQSMAEQLAAYSLVIKEIDNRWFIVILDLGLESDKLLTRDELDNL
jgi:hypothetical protein